MPDTLTATTDLHGKHPKVTDYLTLMDGKVGYRLQFIDANGADVVVVVRGPFHFDHDVARSHWRHG